MAVLIFVYLFRKYPPEQVWQSLQFVNLPYFLAFSIFYFIAIWFIDCFGMARLFTRFGYPTKWAELLAVRSATYLFMIFNYGAAQGGLAYFFKKSKQVPFFKSAGLFLFMLTIDLYWVIFMAALGSFFTDLTIAGIYIPYVVRTVALVSTVFLIINMIFWKVHIPVKLFIWLKERDLFKTFNEASVTDYLIAFLLRLPMHVIIMSGMFIVALTCGAYLPLPKVLAFVPLIILIGVIPITPGGLGATQIATVELFKDVIEIPFLETLPIQTEELLLGISLIWLFANYLLKLFFGLIYFRKVSQKDFFSTNSSQTP